MFPLPKRFLQLRCVFQHTAVQTRMVNLNATLFHQIFELTTDRAVLSAGSARTYPPWCECRRKTGVAIFDWLRVSMMRKKPTNDAHVSL